MVWAARCFRMKHRRLGRWHTTPDCPSLWSPGSRRQAPGKMLGLRELPRDAADALGYVECPYCCPLPACCTSGQHASIMLPRWEASERSAELERELEESAHDR